MRELPTSPNRPLRRDIRPPASPPNREESPKKRMSVEDMVDRLHQKKAIDDLEVGTLHRLRKFGNRGSHEDETVNPATSAVLSNVNVLRGLQTKHLGSEPVPVLKLLAGGAKEAL